VHQDQLHHRLGFTDLNGDNRDADREEGAKEKYCEKNLEHRLACLPPVIATLIAKT